MVNRVRPKDWNGHQRLETYQTWVCGYCGDKVASEFGYHNTGGLAIYICPGCGWPSVVGTQVHPGSKPGRAVDHLPPETERAYEEARACMTTNSYTAAVLLSRVLLLHVAKDKGIPDRKDGRSPGYEECVKYLVAEGWIGKRDSAWVDKIRAFGNEANHELREMGEEEASQALRFIQHILESIYEFRAETEQA